MSLSKLRFLLVGVVLAPPCLVPWQAQLGDASTSEDRDVRGAARPVFQAAAERPEPNGAAAATLPVPMWPYAGALPGWACTQWREDADPHAWQDNFVCSSVDTGLHGNSTEAIPGMGCTAITEGTGCAEGR